MSYDDQAVLIEERKDPENFIADLYPDFVDPFAPFQMFEIDFRNPVDFLDYL
jgi:hypothetical protein